MRAGLLVLLVGVTSLCFAACTVPRDPPITHPIVLQFSYSGPPGGFSPALARAFNARNGSLQISIQPSVGFVANAKALQHGQADMGVVSSDVAYLAYTGRLQGETERFDRLRAIAVLRLAPMNLVASGASGIATVEDLRGKRVAIGPDGSGTKLTATLILKAFGVEPSSVLVETLQFVEATERLKAGTLDAMFESAITSESVGHALRSGARLIPIKGPSVDFLQKEYPFFRRTVVRRGAYPGTSSVETVGVDAVLICRADIPEEIIYEFMTQMFDAVPTLPDSVRRNLVGFDDALAAPIPLHDGAARYYREQELRR